MEMTGGEAVAPARSGRLTGNSGRERVSRRIRGRSGRDR